MNKFGLKTIKNKTAKWSGSRGIEGGGSIKYEQIVLNDKMTVINTNLNKPNVSVEPPYDFHVINKLGDR